MKLNKAYSCAELSNILKGECEKNKSNLFDTVSSIDYPAQNSLGFIFQDKVINDLSSFSGLVISNTFIEDVDASVSLFRVENVKHSLSLLLNMSPNSSNYTNSEDYKNVTIGENVKIGENCTIYPGVFINHNCSIGNNVIIHPNVTIGSDGFGLYKIDGLWKKFLMWDQLLSKMMLKSVQILQLIGVC
jgi:acetyltransferase-like isoleucine patch superfamily enzyme